MRNDVADRIHRAYLRAKETHKEHWGKRFKDTEKVGPASVSLTEEDYKELLKSPRLDKVRINRTDKSYGTLRHSDYTFWVYSIHEEEESYITITTGEHFKLPSLDEDVFPVLNIKGKFIL